MGNLVGFGKKFDGRSSSLARLVMVCTHWRDIRRLRLQGVHCQRGFTLLELLVVVAIIGLLAAYVGPKYFTQIGRSEQTVAKAQIESFRGALGAYRIDTGAYPTTEEGLAVLVTKPGDSAKAAKWNGPYLEKAPPPDPWGRPYIYRSPVSKDDFEMISYGKDGQPGGTGDDADVSSQ